MRCVLLIVVCGVLCCSCGREEPEPAGVSISIKDDGQWQEVKDV